MDMKVQPAAQAMPALGRLLEGRRGLVLGVANEHSIAWGCARVAHARGARLVLSCLNSKARPFVAPLAEAVHAPLHECNVEQPGALQQLVDAAVLHLGGLDFVVHSIAWAPRVDLQGRVVDSSVEGFNEAMRVSCHSFAELARLVEPHMPEGGSLVTMSYIGADEAVPHYGLMGPVKAALESLVRYMALELGPKGIRVHAVSPGPMPTRAASGLPEFDALMARAAASAPLGRLVTLDEVGGCVAFLVGPDATGMTGQTLYVDGGVHAVR
jgi:enoyl-[acyl-carrier protein] reductase I